MATGMKADGVITIGTSVDTAGINEGLNKVEGSFKRIGKLAAASLGIKVFAKFSKAAIDAASDLVEVQNVVDVAFTSMDKLGNIVEDDRYKIENFAKTAVDNFGMSEFAAKETAGSFAAMGKAMGLTQDQATSMAVELTALTGDFSSFYNISQDYARVAMSAVYTGETETLKRYGIVLTEANLQEYAQAQGIETSVKNMSAREKLILRYNYIQSVTNDIDGDFVRTQDTWANQTRVLSQRWNQFLTVLGNGLTTVLLPLVKILNTLVAALTRWASAMGQVLAKLFGIQIQDLADNQGSLADTGSDAADAEQNLADSTKNAADAAKDALGAYDKLNVIQQDTSKASKGSGAGADIDLDPIKFTTGQGAISAALEKLKLDINSFYELGQYVGGKITDILNSIPWDKAYEKARNFGTGLADFLNGLISPELFSAVGKTVANSLNTAIYTALSFGQEFDFTNLGLSIASGVNSFFENFDFNSLGQTIRNWSIGILNTIKTIITNIDWSQILDGIFNFIDGLGVNGFMALVGLTTIKTLMKSGIFKAFSEGLSEGLELVPLTVTFKNFGIAVGKAWKGIEWGAIITSHQPLLIIYKVLGQMTSAWAAGAKLLFSGGAATAAQSALNFMSTSMRLFSAIPLIITGAITALKSFFDMWKNGWSLLKTILEALGIALTAIGAIILGAPATITAVVAGVAFAVSQIVILVKDHWDQVCEILENVGTWIKENVIDTIVTFFTGLGTNVKEVFQNVSDTIKNIWNTISGWFNDNIITPIGRFFTDLGTSISTAFTTAWYNIVSVWTVVTTWFNDNVITPITTIFEEATTRIGQFFEGCWIIIKAIWILASDWFTENIIDPIVTKFTAFKNSVIILFSDTWDGIKHIWEVVSDWFNEHIIQPVIIVFTFWKATVTDIFSDAWDKIKRVWSVVSGFFSNIGDAIKFTFEAVTSTVSGAFETAWNSIKLVWETVSDFFSHVGDKIADTFTTVTDKIGNAFSDVWDLIEHGAKSVVNSVISVFEHMVNGIIRGINGFLRIFNRVVSAASKITGDRWGGVDLISEVHIPRLAKGAVIPPNKEFMAILGDQKQGTNIETPLSTMIEAFTAALDARGGSSNNQPIVLQLPNGKVIAELVWDEEEKRYKQTGSPKPYYA